MNQSVGDHKLGLELGRRLVLELGRRKVLELGCKIELEQENSSESEARR